jgi:cell division protein FtsW
VAVLVCLIAGWRWWFTLFLILPASAGFYWFVWLEAYRRIRLEVWWDPWQHFTGKGWHICQSLMGIGSGGLTGVGLGAGIQKLYIPEVTTDFIFAAICEEMGMLGGLLVLGLFGALVWRAVRVVRSAPDRFSFLLASGILLTIGLQAAMNIGVVTGALPAKGISLPFISYGGSGLVLMSFAAGLLIAVARAAAAGPGGQAAGAPAAPPHPLVYVPTPISDVRAPGGSALVSAAGAGDSPATAAESDPLEQDRVA